MKCTFIKDSWGWYLTPLVGVDWALKREFRFWFGIGKWLWVWSFQRKSPNAVTGKE